MVDRSLLSEISRLYGLKVEQTAQVTEGYLSENHILQTPKQRYFLKQYRFRDEKRVQEVQMVKRYLAKNGLPVVLPLANQHRETYFSFQGRFYAVFPFVDGKKMTLRSLSDRAVQAMGATLAHLHFVGRAATLAIEDQFKPWDQTAILEKINTIEQTIEHQPKRSRFDQDVMELLESKKQLIRQYRITYEELNLPADHLIHGDYTDRNIFFNDQDQVRHIFDLEKSQYAPRMYELYRCLFYSLIDYRQLNQPQARLFLDQYLNIYPADHKELQAGLLLFYMKDLCSVWVPAEYYLNNNPRVAELFYEEKQRQGILSHNYYQLEKQLTR